MNVKIRGVEDSKDHDNERLVLDVDGDTDIGDHLVLDTTYTSDGNVSNRARHPYWFPDQKAKKGDVVVVYDKKGTNTKEERNGCTIYFYFWGLNSSVWNDDGDCAVLL